MQTSKCPGGVSVRYWAAPGRPPSTAELLSVDDSTTDLYLSSTTFAELGSTVALVPDPLGFVAVRVVDDDAWAVIERSAAEQFGIAPRGAVVLDLLESGDPRHWIAAERLAGTR